MPTMAGAARGAGHLFAINLCVGVCANRTGGHCVVSTICHGRQEGRRGRRAGGGGRKSGIFLWRFGEFVCLAICVTKKHSLLNFIRRNGRMGVAYDNTLIMHCMLLCVCVSVFVGAYVWIACCQQILWLLLLVAVVIAARLCFSPPTSLYLSLSVSHLAVFLAFASTFVARSLYTIRLVLAFNLVCVCEVVVVGFCDVVVAFCQFKITF